MKKLTTVLSLVLVLCLGLFSFEARSGLCLQTGSDFDYCNKYKKKYGPYTFIYLQCDQFQPFGGDATYTSDRCTKLPE
jgi:hypothetical protein